MTLVADTLDSFAQAHARLDAERGAEPVWLHAMRDRAFERFRALGFPTTRLEEWRFTNVAPIARARFELPDAPDAPCVPDASAASDAAVVPGDLSGWDRAEAVCVNGRFVEALARRAGLPEGVRVEGLAAAMARDPVALEAWLGSIADTGGHAFTALNTAFLADGVYVHVPRGLRVELPIRIVFATTEPARERAVSGTPAPKLTPAANGAAGPNRTPGPVDGPASPVTHPRVLVVVEAGASVRLIEDYRGASPGQSLANAVTEIALVPGASAEHTSLLADMPDGFHVGTVYGRQAGDSRFDARPFALGGRLVRRDVRVTFAGEGAEAQLEGLYVVTGSEHVDHHTLVDHAVPRCRSRELYKGVLAGASRAVWNGAVVIRPDAQKSDAAQSNMNLLLSTDAVIDTKPELQIFADDVKCNHGATVGQLDDDQLFYLRARGIGENAARALLTHAFAREVVERVPHAGFRADLDALVERRMQVVAATGSAR